MTHQEQAFESSDLAGVAFMATALFVVTLFTRRRTLLGHARFIGRFMLTDDGQKMDRRDLVAVCVLAATWVAVFVCLYRAADVLPPGVDHGHDILGATTFENFASTIYVSALGASQGLILAILNRRHTSMSWFAGVITSALIAGIVVWGRRIDTKFVNDLTIASTVVAILITLLGVWVSAPRRQT